MGYDGRMLCHLEVGTEGTYTLKNADGSSASVPSGTFRMTWDFDEDATGVLSSDHADDQGGTLNGPHGSRQIKTATSITYTLTVSKDGEEDVSCSATATHHI